MNKRKTEDLYHPKFKFSHKLNINKLHRSLSKNAQIFKIFAN